MNDMQLRYFLSACETNSFSRTAEFFFTSQPTVSIQIKQLEKEIGFQLFERSNNGCILTESGRAYANFIREYMDQHQHLCDIARRSQIVKHVGLKVGIMDNCYSPTVYDALLHTHETYPDQHISITSTDIEQLESDLYNRHLDVVITPKDVINSTQYTQYNSIEVDTIDIVLVFRYSDKYPRCGFYTIEDFRDEQLIVTKMDSSRYNGLLENAADLFTSKGLFMPRIITVPNDKSIFSAIRSGLGVGLDTADQPELLRGDLGSVKTGYSSTIVAIGRDHQKNNTMLHTFLSSLEYYRQRRK